MALRRDLVVASDNGCVAVAVVVVGDMDGLDACFFEGGVCGLVCEEDRRADRRGRAGEGGVVPAIASIGEEAVGDGVAARGIGCGVHGSARSSSRTQSPSVLLVSKSFTSLL